jgi:hypothetical protein
MCTVQRSTVHAIPDRGDGLLQSLAAIHDQQLGTAQAAADEIIEHAALGFAALFAHALDREQHLLAVARTTNAIEVLHEEFKRRIKTQTVLPSAETAAMLFWALLTSGQISMRKGDGWRTLAKTSIGQSIDLAA